MTTDAELAAASASGDREAFRRIVERYQSLLCAVAYSSSGDLAQSEDIAQEAFVAAWRGLGRLRDGDRLRAWLLGILRNVVNATARRRKRDAGHDAVPLADAAERPSPEPTPAQQALRREEEQVLWRALAGLPEAYRVPLVLYYRQGRSVAAVAELLELSQDAAKQRLARGRRMLKSEMAAFVEGALERTAPGSAFAVAVVGSLPVAGGGTAAKTGGTGMLKAGIVGAVVAAAVTAGILARQPETEPVPQVAPAQGSPRPPAAQFGPETQYVLPGNGFLDLDSGELVDLPAQLDGTATIDWIRKSGADLGYEGRGNSSMLGWNTVCVPWANDAYETGTPEDVIADPYVALGRPAFPALLQTGGALPATFAFVTAQGSIGVLQITKLEAQGRGAATIRCKVTPSAGQVGRPAVGPPPPASDDPLPATAFGPAVEAVLGDRRGQAAGFIDFDTQRTLSAPPGARDLEAILAWMGENGVDAFGDVGGAVRGLVGVDMFVMPWVDREWERGRPDEVAMYMDLFRPGFPMYIPAVGELPATYLIRTREGTIGMLQVLGEATDPTPSVRFRYKMAGEDPTLDLHQAARKGDNRRVRTLLEEGGDPNARDEDGRTPLHLAASYGRVEVARLLLRAGADLGAFDRRGCTPLHAAAGSIPPHQPKGSPQVEVMRLLLAAGADPNAATAESGETPLYQALRNGDHCLEAVEVLLANGASAGVRNREQQTPLFLAARYRTPAAARLLIEHGADVHAQDVGGDTPLHAAAHARHVEVARLLLERGADLEARNSGGYTPLNCAVGPDSLEIVKFLIERGADVNAADSRGNTPTGRAVQGGYDEVAALLTEHGGVQ